MRVLACVDRYRGGWVTAVCVPARATGRGAGVFRPNPRPNRNPVRKCPQGTVGRSPRSRPRCARMSVSGDEMSATLAAYAQEWRTILPPRLAGWRIAHSAGTVKICSRDRRLLHRRGCREGWDRKRRITTARMTQSNWHPAGHYTQMVWARHDSARVRRSDLRQT